MRCLGLLVLAMGLGVCATPAWAESGQVRFGLVAGNNLGRDPARTLRYAEEEVGRLSDLLRSSGDFDEVVTLRGASKAEIEAALVQMQQRLEAARRSGRQTLFLFYYSGHGDNDALEIGSERLLLRDLRTFLERLKSADVRVAFVDACQSGALTGVKGGRRTPGYEVRLADPGRVKGMAIVTSSTANELSQESDDLRGSFFSQSIMAGLRGAADTSRDGQVTLGEVYQFAFNRTLSSTAANLTGGQHPTYDYRMAGAGEVVLTRTRPRDARLAFVREAGATYAVVSRSSGDVLAEVTSSPNEDLYLAVPAGEYRFVRRTIGEVRERTLALAPGSVTVVEPSGMVKVEQPNARSKSAEIELRNQLGAYAGLSTSVVPGSPAYVGTLALAFARDLGAFALRGRASVSSFDAQQNVYRSTLLRAGVSVDLLLPVLRVSRFSVGLGPSVGMPIARQEDMFGTVTSSFGLSYGAALVLNARLYGRTWLSLSLDGGGEVFRLDGQRVHRATGSALLGAVLSL
ncbi:MAG: caspase family protein [Deltaproteobacteria bacterium]|nr:caspase family protein [Deltaproteobacteria bacterium]